MSKKKPQKTRREKIRGRTQAKGVKIRRRGETRREEAREMRIENI